MSQDNIFREVDEELRHERMRGLWRRFGPYVIGAAVAVVLVVAINEGWAWWQNSRSAEQSDRFYAALDIADGGDVAAAQAALNEIAASGGGYATLARFKQASLLAQDGKTQEALAAYDALATAESNPRLRELALVFAGNLLADEGDVAAVQQRVGALTGEENPMRNAAREILGLTQYKAGALEDARASFVAISEDPLASQELLGRVQLYLAQLESQGIMAPEPVVEQPSAASEGGEPGADEPPNAIPSQGEATEAAPATTGADAGAN